MRQTNDGERKLDALNFRRATVDAYYRLFRKKITQESLCPGNRNLHYPTQNLRYDGIGHWLIKGSQRRCDLVDFKVFLRKA